MVLPERACSQINLQVYFRNVSYLVNNWADENQELNLKLNTHKWKLKLKWNGLCSKP